MRQFCFLVLMLHTTVSADESVRLLDGGANMNYRDIVSQLANQNPAPSIRAVFNSKWPYFPEDYDWKEQERILKTSKAIVVDVEKAWLPLVDNLKNENYSLTFEHEMSAGNYTVGNVCNIILLETLTAAYLPFVNNVDAYRELRHPSIIRDEVFGEWCRDVHTKGVPLYRLQIEMSEWAIRAISRLERVTEEDKTSIVQRIQDQVGKLRKEKKPILLESIVLKETRRPFSKEKARRIREKIDANDEKRKKGVG